MWHSIACTSFKYSTFSIMYEHLMNLFKIYLELTWLDWSEQPVGSPGFWSNKTLNPTLINKIIFVDCLGLYVE
jgi:hypothetical protein